MDLVLMHLSLGNLDDEVGSGIAGCFLAIWVC